MVDIDLEHTLRLDAAVLVAGDGREVLLHLQGDVAVGAETHGMGLEGPGGPHVDDIVAEGLLHEVQDLLLGFLPLVGGLLLLLGLQSEVASGHVAELLAVVLPEGLRGELVHVLAEA